MLNTVSLCGMFNINLYHEDYDHILSRDSGSLSGEETICSRKIRDTIDQNHLGIGKFTCCRHFLGSIASYYKTCLLSKKAAKQEIQKIEAYIPKAGNSKDIFQKLVARHWYVHYVVEALVKEKIKKFENVNGFTIDKLYTPDFSKDINGVKEMIHIKAKQSFFKDIVVKNQLEASYRKFADIHFTVLYGHTQKINPSSLIMSSDSKYLKSKDMLGNKIIWLIKTGEQAHLNDEEYKNIQWSSINIPPYLSPCAIDNNNHYYATSIKTPFASSVKVDPNKPAITLYQNPGEQSYLCQRAFENNQESYGLERDKERLALKDSNCFKAIKGFPRGNLELLIDKGQRSCSVSMYQL